MEQEFIDSLMRIFERDLNKLEYEIGQYPHESMLWEIRGAIKNPAGNLCLHLCGNLQHYIGKVLGKSPYVRNRDHEFAAKDIPREQLLTEISKTKDSVINALKTLDAATLNTNYTERVFDHPMTTLHFLIHLAAHLSYHLGQVNYHRRMTEPEQ